MLKHWYVYIIIAIVAELLLTLDGKYDIMKFIKWEPLRTFVVLFVASFLCWCAYDLIV